jgi:hypothetical protein
MCEKLCFRNEASSSFDPKVWEKSSHIFKQLL